MKEMLDIYDANLTPLGSMDRVEVHLTGQWHKTFHCWVTTSLNGRSLLFQRRSSAMTNYPGLLDVSAAGHLEAGESVEQGIREVTEELGIPLRSENLTSLGYRVEVVDQQNGQRNREYQAVYLAQVDAPLSEYCPQREEVDGLYWLSIEEGFRLFGGNVDSVSLSGISSKGTSSWKPDRISVSSKDFLPRIQSYYLTVLIMAERLLDGRFPLAIS